MQVIVIKNEAEYELLKKRLDNGEKYLDGKWFNPEYEKLVALYQAMGVAVLNWEIENDLLPI